jgi:hypothetical protein
MQTFTTKDNRKIWLLRHIWTDDKNRKHCYSIYARPIIPALGTPGVPDAPGASGAWNVSDESNYTILDASFDLSKGVIQYWTETGLVRDGHVARSEPSYIKKGLAGRSLLEQAFLTVKSKYEKYVRAHTTNVLPFPQAVHKYEDHPVKKHLQLRYPLDIQPKLDGVRVVATWDKEVVLYSRRREIFQGQNEIRKELEELFANSSLLAIGMPMANVYLDGEIYKKGMPLQQISGLVRREDGSESPLEYHIFDIFTMEKMPWEARSKLLRELGETFDKYSRLKIVSSLRANSEEEAEVIYQKMLKDGYEGSIYRNLDALYEYGMTKEIRTYGARKRKPRYDGEYIVVDFKAGTHGKDINAIVWILSTEGSMNYKTDPPTPFPTKQFNSVPNMPIEERCALFKSLSADRGLFIAEYFGKKMTVEYDDISEDGIPIRARALQLRCD